MKRRTAMASVITPSVFAVWLLAACSVPPGPAPTGTARSEPVASAPLVLGESVGRRAAHSATTLPDGRVLVAGGCVVDGCTTATASTVLIGPDSARAAAPLKDARDAHTATLLPDGSVLVAGGFGAEGTPPLASIERYDRERNRWIPVASLTVGRGGHAAALLGDGRVLLAGGWTGPRTYTRATEIYDAETGTVTLGPALPAAVDGLSAVRLADGSVLVTGGQTSPGRATNAAVRIDPSGSATRVGPLAHARFKHTMALLASGEVLVVGGTSDDEDLLRSTELYDPATRAFRPGPVLGAGRYKLAGAAVTLPDGRVLVAGGGPGAEVIDPVAGSSAVIPSIPAVRASFSTANLIGDRAVVIGGYDERIRLTGTALVVPLSALRP